LDTRTQTSERKHLISQEWFEGLLDVSLDCIIAIDEDGRVVEFNRAAERVFGYLATEAIGQLLSALIIPERYRDKHSSSLAEYVRAQRSNIIGRRIEISAVTKSGSEIPIELTVLPILSHGCRYFISYLRDLSGRKASEEKIASYLKQLEATIEGTLLAVSSMVEMRDPYTAGHERRVGIISADIARELGWAEVRCKHLQMVGTVHDIGKNAIPAELLSKPGRLTALEFKMIQGHAEKGYEILKNLEFPLPIGEIIRQHHERMDGSGYPRGLKGEQILPEARVIAVADVLESMATHRPYRPAMGISAALEELTTHSGTWYDALVVAAVSRMIREKNYQLPA
jgi:PAS domain S-box-containing protein/putative nucleotidyltransferase with HDIG domain